MSLLTSDLDNVARCKPTEELPPAPTPNLMGTNPISMVYDVYITKDPTGAQAQAYLIDVPGEMNFEDVNGTRRLRLFQVIPAWYLQNEKKATWGVADGRLPNTMQLGLSYIYIITDDYQINRPHIYHPPDTRVSYPYNLGCEEEDDKDQNADPSRWENIKEALRRFLTNKWVQRIALSFLFGALINWLWQDIVGPAIGACAFTIISRTAIVCANGLPGERILYKANNCSIHTYDSCTGEDKEVTPPPAAGIGLIEIGIGLAIIVGTIIVGAALLGKGKKEKAAAPPPPGAPPQLAAAAPAPRREAAPALPKPSSPGTVGKWFRPYSQSPPETKGGLGK